MVSAIVLAAGTSTRMGNLNKLLLPYGNKTMIQFVVEKIIDAEPAEIIVVTGYEPEAIINSLQNPNIKFIYNPDYLTGMTTSIQKGVSIADGNGYMICLGDMAHITTEEYQLLKNNFEKEVTKNEDCICVPVFENKKGNPVIFSSCYKREILLHLNMGGCSQIVKSHKENIIQVNMPAASILADIDYFTDYKESVLNNSIH